MKKTHVLGFGGTALAGLLLVALAGCGSGNGTSPITPPLGTSASPSVPVVIPTPLPSASASASVPTPAGDFAFASSVTEASSSAERNIALAADGTGSTTFALQSVNGFTSPVTFPYTVTIQGPVMQPDNTQQTFDSNLATVTVNPATLNTLPKGGSTTVALSVKASTTLPPLSTVTVDLHAEGGGLQRYPTVGPYSNGGKFIFTTPGLRFYSVFFANRLGAAAGSTVSGSAYFQSSGLTGTGTPGITGLPSGVAVSFTKPTVAVPGSATDSNAASFAFTLTATGDVAPGTYPVRATLILNGVTYTSDPVDLVVGDVFKSG